MVTFSQKSAEGVKQGLEAGAVDERTGTGRNTPCGSLEGTGLLGEESDRVSCCPEKRLLRLIFWSVGRSWEKKKLQIQEPSIQKEKALEGSIRLEQKQIYDSEKGKEEGAYTGLSLK